MAARYLMVSLGTIIHLILSVRTQDNRPTPGAVQNYMWTAQFYPNPQNQPAACGMPVPSWICDPGRIITPSNYATSTHMVGNTNFLDKIIKQTDRGTRGVCETSKNEGYKMAVGVVGIIQNSVGVSPPYSNAANQFADYLRQGSWAVGSCGNDVVVVLELNTKSIGVSIGSVASNRLSIDTAKKLAQTASNRLTNDNAGEELGWLLSKYQNYLMDANNSFTNFEYFLAAWGVLLGAAIVIAVIGSLIRCTYKTYRVGKKKMPPPEPEEYSMHL